jgi:hypothetical protein
MPHYRVDLPPSQLRYRDCLVTLEIVRGPAEEWIWRAVKPSGDSVELLRRPTLVAFSQDRYQGFDVEPGTSADRIMQRLVREGAAQVVQPGTVFVRSARERR